MLYVIKVWIAVFSRVLVLVLVLELVLILVWFLVLVGNVVSFFFRCWRSKLVLSGSLGRGFLDEGVWMQGRWGEVTT